ncbi:hypothetical protein V1292_003440 [Bradyrhizobium sp. AZCC 1719]|uniref:hypothetical protein n=1 Tax=Bradyrhizobium sp. AZCC 1719 TaxID=3117028 RepID=UPI002FF33033
MRRFKQGFFRILFWIVGVVLAVTLALVAQEIVTFSTSTEVSARDQARQEFLRECARSNLNPNEFTGPTPIKSPKRTYGFVWVSQSNGDQIATMVVYFPFRVESWLIRARDGGGKFQPYCDEKTACP